MTRTGFLCLKEMICSRYYPFFLLSAVCLGLPVTNSQNPHLETLLTCNPGRFLGNTETNTKYNT